jgi:hypothetical protein
LIRVECDWNPCSGNRGGSVLSAPTRDGWISEAQFY